MLIEVNGYVFDTKDVLYIGDIKKDSVLTYKFEIKFKNNTSKDIYVNRFYNSTKHKIEMIKEETKLIKDMINFRQEIIDVWNEDKKEIPKFSIE